MQTPVKQHGSMETNGDEPFSGVAVGAAFGGAFGAGIGAIYDAHHAGKEIEAIEKKAAHSKPNSPDNYTSETADLTDLDAK